MADDQQAALLAQIKALSGAIDQRKSSNSQHGRGGYGAQRGSSSYSTYRGRGRGRGAHSGAPAQPLPSRHRSLVLSGPQASTSRTGGDDDAAQSSGDGWVKRKSTHNMSLVSSKTFEKTEPARLASLAAKHSAKEAKGIATMQSKPKGKREASIRRGENMGEVIIDGVTFEFDETGTKLVKKAVAASSSSDVAPESDSVDESKGQEKEGSVTPLHTSVNGQKFVRTKTGNMISQALLDQRKENKRNSEKLKRMEQVGKEIAERQRLRDAGRKAAKASVTERKSKTLCAYFTKTGQCKNGLRCPYKHDLSRVAICPRFLRPNGCPLPEGTCPLSHKPTAERVPHCVHFLNSGACRNGDGCTYVHPLPTADGQTMSNDSPICMQFSDFGWCAKGKACDRRHTWDCPEFLRKGKCDRRGCRLMHVVRASTNNTGAGTRQLDDEELFLRDDEAAGGAAADDGDGDGEDEGERSNKRKRGEEETDEADEEFGDDEKPITFKVRTSKSFSGQNDFISLDDGDEDEDDESADDEQEQDETLGGDHVGDVTAARAGSVSSLDEAESVHSDMDREEEEEGGEEEENK